MPPQENETIWTLTSHVQQDNEQPTDQRSNLSENQNETKNMNKRQRIRKDKEITIATVNVRGLKGNIKSLESLLQLEQITIALLTETMMNNNDQISIKGYRWAERPRKNNKGGGVGILISEKIAQDTIEHNECEEQEHLELKWIRLECRPKNIAIGVFYGPQENEKIDKVQEIYSALNNQFNQQAENN